MNKKKQEIKSFVYLKVFVLIIFLSFLISISFRIVNLIKDSNFKDYSFTLLVQNKQSQVIKINKKTNTVSMLILDRKEEDLRGKYKLSSSLRLNIPLDGVISYKLQDATDFLSFNNLFQIISNPSKFTFYDCNEVDALKMYIYSKFIPKENLQVKKVLSNNNENINLINTLFSDETIINEKSSIEIINGTSIDGLGSKVSQMLENVGFNIISVKTSDSPMASKIIYHGKKDSSLKKLSSIFDLNPQYSLESSISDITIILGPDLKY